MKYLIGLMMLLTLSPVFSQNADKEITEGFNIFNQAIKEGQFEKAADYIGEEMFTVVPKSQFVGMLKMMFNNPRLEIKLSLPEILTIGEVMKIKEKFYVIIHTKSNQKIRFVTSTGEVEKLDSSSLVQQTYEAWKTQLGEENISYDKGSGFFTLNAKGKTLAVSPNGKTSWKYLNVDEATRPMLQQVLPQEVMSKL